MKLKHSQFIKECFYVIIAAMEKIITISDTHAAVNRLKKEFELPEKTAEGLVYLVQEAQMPVIDNLATKEDFTEVKGDLTEVKDDLAKLKVRIEKVEERLTKVEERLEKVEERLDKVEERLEKVEERLDKVEERLEKVEERLDKVESSILELTTAVRELNLSQKWILSALGANFALLLVILGNLFGIY